MQPLPVHFVVMNLLRSVMAVLYPVFLIVLVALLALFLFQNKLLYYPTLASIDTYVPDGMSIWPLDEDAVETPAQNVLGLYAPAAPGVPPIGVAVVFHGNAGHAGHRDYYAQQLAPLGLQTILAEYPGYGTRGSLEPDESTLIEDAIATVQLVKQQHAGPIWVIGESLGAGVASAVAGALANEIAGVLLITPWNTLKATAKHHYPFLPVGLLLRSSYDSVEALSRFTGPVYIVIAENDNIIPAPLGHDLYQNVAQPKKHLELMDAGHNTWIDHLPENFWHDAMLWLRHAK